MRDLLFFLLTAPPETDAPASLAAFWEAHRARAARWEAPIDRAVAGGFSADRLGFAFAAGYHAALLALAPSLPADRIIAFCATEEGGAHPRAIRTSLAPAGGKGSEEARGGLGRSMTLHGRKRWSTLAPEAAELLIVASTGEDESGKNRLRVVRISAHAPGVMITPMPATPFAPEIPHAEVFLDGAPVAEADVLPGDGYDDYVKPFRTLEDLHVHGALLGYLLGVARRRRSPQAIIERLSVMVAGIRAVANEPREALKSPELHIVIAGMLDETRKLVDQAAELWGADVGPDVDEERARWERDRTLLSVAQKARTARRERAWQDLSIVRSPCR